MLANVGAAGLSLAHYEARIELYKEQIGTGYIGIGRTLIEAKDAGVVPHGEWEAWVTRVTGLTARQAQRCMQAATEIRDGSALARLEMSKALALLSSGLGEEEREEVAARAADDGMSVRQLQDEIKRLKVEKVKDAGTIAEIRAEMKKAAEARDQLAAQMRETAEAYTRRLDTEKEKAYQQGMKDNDREVEERIRKEFAGKIDFINAKRRELQQEVDTMATRLTKAANESSRKWDEGYAAGMDEMAKARAEENDALHAELGEACEANRKLRNELDGLKAKLEEDQRISEMDIQRRIGDAISSQAMRDQKVIDELEAKLREAESRGGSQEVERLRAELAAAETRERKKAEQLQALKAEKIGAQMGAARGIRAEGPGALDLAGAVRSFIGAVGVLPQMGKALAGMSEDERAAILAQIETVERWASGCREALAIVHGAGTVQ